MVLTLPARQWIGNELHFRIRKDLRTASGYQITARDAEFSLKRLLVLSSNTHGKFKDLICPGQDVKNITDTCDGITVKDDFTLVLKTDGVKDFLVSMLTAIDFAVIPIPSADPKSLKILDYSNTSGVYYLKKDHGDGFIDLVPNKNHYHYSENIPQEVKLIPARVGEHKSSLTLFEESKVDHITTSDKTPPEKIIDFSKHNDEAILHTTMNIRTFALFFTEKGLKKFTVRDRIAIGKNIRKELRKFYNQKSGYEDRDQLFPSFGDGGLNENEFSPVSDTFERINTAKEAKNLKLEILRVGSLDDYKSRVESSLKGATLSLGKNVPAFSKYSSPNEMPDAFIGGPDISFSEDIGLISYSMNAGIFGLSHKEKDSWLTQYMQTPSKEVRIGKLKKLHQAPLHMNNFLIF